MAEAMSAGNEEVLSQLSQTLRQATAQLLTRIKTELGPLRDSVPEHHIARIDQALALLDAGIRNIRGDNIGPPLVPDTVALPDPPITSRERQVLVRVAAGMTSKQIAGDLGISPRTVETHRESLMRKLGVTSVVGLTRYALEHGITDTTTSTNSV